MPAHTKVTDVGVRELGNGQPLTERDRRGNALADANAKAAAEVHRVPRAVLEAEQTREQRANDAARWLGRVAWLANNQTGPVSRDNDGSRAEALRAKGERDSPIDNKAASRKRWIVKEEGGGQLGHKLEMDDGKWRCMRCLIGGDKASILKRWCKGEAPDRWAQTALRRKAEETTS